MYYDSNYFEEPIISNNHCKIYHKKKKRFFEFDYIVDKDRRSILLNSLRVYKGQKIYSTYMNLQLFSHGILTNSKRKIILDLERKREFNNEHSKERKLEKKKIVALICYYKKKNKPVPNKIKQRAKKINYKNKYLDI